MSGRKGNLASRSLEYQAPETPNFLKALKAQVASSDRYSTSTKQQPSDKLDSFVISTSSAAVKRKAREEDEDEDEDEGLDSEDEMRGAQVVVLKDGKHLSHDEALQLKTASKGQPEEQKEGAKGKVQNIASTGSALGARKRRGPIGEAADESKGLGEDVSISDIINTAELIEKPSREKGKGDGTSKGGLEDVKNLIRKERDARAPKKTDKEQQKDDKRREKIAAAKKLKAKSGKGLSFNFDDE
ncbi:uncharacterized protein UBRO_06237 [Ustilago bromivora]|uniref:DUF4604 domain-containing protein n=1 Tax=Ustilago bromivora TaxID=307758 RepID=A0A1K0HGY1_9BASI|nr:uncharacterized protein UBRO_06237 [Ustilago bromivora]SYW75694.1 uncharacterized protein UBRO2_00849 [Ustilago bromivora]